ncbi:hypothetical protein [uncultured Helicobacter sp.]|uniref:hypothetical protein n=1 Tax=uncultured Helicobacter sp. TaxID=175537 RepID=UPI002639E7EF|nr:hypothetical protein [uncultured Helicobacter sp.]
MDNALERLKQIGVDKIREDTKLDILKIDCILNKRFDKLDGVRAKGFINILEKQYHLDLSFWLEEYKAYHQAHHIQAMPTPTENRENTEKNPFVIWGAVGLIGVVGAILLFSFFPKTSPKIQEEIQVEEVIEQAPASQEVQETQVIEMQDEVQNQASQSQKPEIEQKKISEYGEEVFANIGFNEENVLYIESSKPLWVGIINIDSKKRVAKTKQEFEIPLDKQLLINIARGGFTLSLDDESKDFGGYLPVYLIHTKEGGLREISKEEFIYLNGGVEW